jgi:hypothetical protein
MGRTMDLSFLSRPTDDRRAVIAAAVAEARRLPLGHQPSALSRLMIDAVEEARNQAGYLDCSNLQAFGFTAAEVIEFVGEAIAAALPQDAEAA